MANTETKTQVEMSQIVHWAIFLSCAGTVGVKTLEMAAASSGYIVTNSQWIAQYSWLISGLI